MRHTEFWSRLEHHLGTAYYKVWAEQFVPSGLTAVAELFHRFAPAAPGAPAGVTGVVLLAESHVAVHTWPEQGAVTLDVYVCNFGADNSARAEQLLRALVEAFAPRQVQRHALQRGRA